MMRLPGQRRVLALLAVLVPLLVLFVYVALRSGPLAPVAVVLAAVEERAVAPGLFGIGTVESRYTYRIGPGFTGRLLRLDVEVGDRVSAGQILGEMDPVDLDERMRAQAAALMRAEAQLAEARARRDHASAQLQRYEKLSAMRAVSEELADTRRQELQVTEAGVEAAEGELARLRAEGEALTVQRQDLRLIAPVAGLVVAREAEPGTTIVAGRTVVEVIDPESLWINVRFDQVRAAGLATDLPARIVLRSRRDEARPGRVLRVEPLADVVTEEILAKVRFDALPEPLPPLGELAEVTVTVPAGAPGPAIPNAAIQRNDGRIGVWRIVGGDLRFVPVILGAADLEGYVQVREGLDTGDRVVVYSEKALTPRSRVDVVERLPGVPL